MSEINPVTGVRITIKRTEGLFFIDAQRGKSVNYKSEFMTSDAGKALAKVGNLLGIKPNTNRKPDREFIEWHGGDCPVAGDALVTVILCAGITETGPAGDFRWDWQFDGQAGGDIIGYRSEGDARRCSRRLKLVSGEGVHTCTPTARWRDLEQQRDALIGVLNDLFDIGLVFTSAIEQKDFSGDFEAWKRKARAVMAGTESVQTDNDGKPYFTVNESGFGSGWSAGHAVAITIDDDREEEGRKA